MNEGPGSQQRDVWKDECGLIKATQKIGEVFWAVGLCLTYTQPLQDIIKSLKPAANSANGSTKATKLFPVMDTLNTKFLLVCSSALPANQLNHSTQTAVNNVRAIGTATANWFSSPQEGCLRGVNLIAGPRI
ncbi:hypothetical protein PCANC_09167 [Puccinia coronata f. sp. avenae]|uniref:Uncharacterized protein n=1 Tax=Puccinia coronata f. sp. avenae TaxID=200324 RepID=A0A2N5VV56_9BASI|nr:hypothetical protein PCASD_09608 [Puccinia coronata f. sp. avenae]PLW53873.1 hypothetical protein PCANC_09167 [Puccinia coronata f. sp. avenae]